MATSGGDDEPLIGPERQMLEVMYEAFALNGQWPTFLYVSSRVWEQVQAEPRDIYIELSERNFVRPAITRSHEFQLRDDTTVGVSLQGLMYLGHAQEDIGRFVSGVRYVADRAGRFRPSSATELERLSVTGEEIRLHLDIDPGDRALARLGTLLSEEAWGLWSSFSGSGSNDWSFDVNVEQARRYRDIHTLIDFLSIRNPDRQFAATEPISVDLPQSDVSPAVPTDERGTAHRTIDDNEPIEPHTFCRSAISDLPSEVDLLGYRPIVRALHGLINDERTVLPLAIAITARWGAGKSSVMSQLKSALDRDSSEGNRYRRWTTVRFDAWKYERGERLWAALAKAIYEQPQQTMKRRERLWFRFRLEWQRRGSPRVVAAALAPCLTIVAFVLILVTAGASGLDAAAAGAAAIAAGLGIVTRFGKLIFNPFGSAIDRYARRPDYEAHLGFTAEADRDIGVLTQLLAPDDKHGLAVFVDDLDRCGSTHIVEIVEAMNQIFNAAGDHRCVFVLGLDRDVVTANIEAAYKNVIERLDQDDASLGKHFGQQFLAKLVQLSVSLPEPTAEALQALMEQVTGNTRIDSPAGADIRADFENRDPGDTDMPTPQRTESHQPLPGNDDEPRSGPPQRIRDSPAISDAEFVALNYLDRNPRQVKRFHNAFRLQLYVANEDHRTQFDFTADELIALAKWVAIRIRWPDLGYTLEHDHELLRVIEAEANNEPPPEDASQPALQKAQELLLDPAVCNLMKDSERRRLSALELKTFLRVA